MELALFGDVRELWGEAFSKLRERTSLPMKIAADLVNEVKERGLESVLDLTERFDGIRLTKDEIYGAPRDYRVDGFVLEPYERLYSCAVSLLDGKACSVDGFKTELEWIKESAVSEPVKRVGIYVPGGRHPLPSSLLMGIAPAKAAGVEEFVVATPPRNSALIEGLAAQLGVDEVLRAGGIQAIASLAYGLPEVDLEPVDMIVGPGNSYVTAAKAVISKDVRIDLLAGPSEVLILYDGSSPVEFVVMDMLAQAEHGPDSISLALVTSKELALKLREELSRYSGDERISSLRGRGGILYGDKRSLESFSDAFMPEHLEVMGDFDAGLAGAVFEGVGVVYGDYGYTGANHILPTGGTLMERPGLSPFSFFEGFSGIYVYRQSGTLEAQASIAERVAKFARLEGLEYHARSAEIRGKIYKGPDAGPCNGVT